MANSTRVLGTNFDILTIADSGELYRVEDGVACLLSRASIPETDDHYGREWVLVRADSGAQAKEIAQRYDDVDGCDLHGQDLCVLELE